MNIGLINLGWCTGGLLLGSGLTVLVVARVPPPPSPAPPEPRAISWFIEHPPEIESQLAKCRNSHPVTPFAFAECANAQHANEKIGMETYIAKAKKEVGW